MTNKQMQEALNHIYVADSDNFTALELKVIRDHIPQFGNIRTVSFLRIRYRAVIFRDIRGRSGLHTRHVVERETKTRIPNDARNGINSFLTFVKNCLAKALTEDLEENLKYRRKRVKHYYR